MQVDFLVPDEATLGKKMRQECSVSKYEGSGAVVEAEEVVWVLKVKTYLPGGMNCQSDFRLPAVSAISDSARGAAGVTVLPHMKGGEE